MATGSSTLVEVDSDGGLVLATLAGDHAAFTRMYDRFATPVYDLHLALLRDPEQAAKATYTTFQRAVAELNDLGNPGQLRPWLYAMVYRNAKPPKSVQELHFRGIDGRFPLGEDPQAPLWRSLPDNLTRLDRALITLHLRHGLDYAGLATAVGMSKRRAQARVDELRVRLDPNTRPLLHGGPRPAPDQPPLAAAIPLVPPPPAMRKQVLAETALITAHQRRPGPKTPRAWVTTLLTVILLLGGTVLFVQRNLERAPPIAVRFGPASEFALSSTVVDLGAANSAAKITLSNSGGNQLAWKAAPEAPWLKVDPSSGTLTGGKSQELTLAVNRDALPEGDGRTQLKVSSSDNLGEAEVAVALREERPPAIINARASANRIGGYGCPTVSTISATVRDESGPVKVILLGPGSQSQTMQANGETYTGRLGSGTGANFNWRIQATDARGNTVTSPPQLIMNADCAARPTPKTSASAPPSVPASASRRPSSSATPDKEDRPSRSNSPGDDSGNDDEPGGSSGRSGGSGGSDEPGSPGSFGW